MIIIVEYDPEKTGPRTLLVCFIVYSNTAECQIIGTDSIRKFKPLQTSFSTVILSIYMFYFIFLVEFSELYPVSNMIRQYLKLMLRKLKRNCQESVPIAEHSQWPFYEDLFLML